MECGEEGDVPAVCWSLLSRARDSFESLIKAMGRFLKGKDAVHNLPGNISPLRVQDGTCGVGHRYPVS